MIMNREYSYGKHAALGQYLAPTILAIFFSAMYFDIHRTEQLLEIVPQRLYIKYVTYSLFMVVFAVLTYRHRRKIVHTTILLTDT